MVVWICFPRYRWYEDEPAGCGGRHPECGWFELVEPQEVKV